MAGMTPWLEEAPSWRPDRTWTLLPRVGNTLRWATSVALWIDCC